MNHVPTIDKPLTYRPMENLKVNKPQLTMSQAEVMFKALVHGGKTQVAASKQLHEKYAVIGARGDEYKDARSLTMALYNRINKARLRARLAKRVSRSKLIHIAKPGPKPSSVQKAVVSKHGLIAQMEAILALPMLNDETKLSIIRAILG